MMKTRHTFVLLQDFVQTLAALLPALLWHGLLSTRLDFALSLGPVFISREWTPIRAPG